MKILKVVLVLIGAVLFANIVFGFLVRVAPLCTIDNGAFWGSEIIQTCTCIGFEYFPFFEAGVDSKCIGYVSETIIVD